MKWPEEGLGFGGVAAEEEEVAGSFSQSDPTFKLKSDGSDEAVLNTTARFAPPFEFLFLKYFP